MKLGLKTILCTTFLYMLLCGGTVFAATPGIINGDGVNFRSGPGFDHAIYRVLEKNTNVSIIGISGEWAAVNCGNISGFVYVKYVTPVGTYLPSRGSISRATTTEAVVKYAEQYLGVPYAYGGTGPRGFDCSGFAQYVYAAFGYNLPRTAAEQASAGVKVSQSELMPGDLVFFNTEGYISHVGIYKGGGAFIHSPKPGQTVKITKLSGDPRDGNYYINRYVTARRVLETE